MKFTLTETELTAAVIDFVQRKTGLYRKMEVEFSKPRTGDLSAEVDIDIMGGPTIAIRGDEGAGATETKYQSAEEEAKAPKPKARAATKSEVTKAVEPKPEPTPDPKEAGEDLPPFNPDPQDPVAAPNAAPEKKSLFGA